MWRCQHFTPHPHHTPKSAGFSFPGQWPHSLLSVCFKISFTLWHTNCFHIPLFSIQHKAVLLSDQYLISFISTFIFAFLTLLTRFVKTSADISSNLGIVRVFKGATLVLLVNKLTKPMQIRGKKLSLEYCNADISES